jgi:hypothetical protein
MGTFAMQVVRSAGWRCYGVMLLLVAAALAGLAGGPAQAERIENGTANFAALDKVTAMVRPMAVGLNKTEQFRTLKITPRACFTSDPSEVPRTSTFVEVDEVLIDGSEKRIFSGWMFAESPGLNPLVHPVFDVWLTGCSQPKTSTASKAPGPGGGASDTGPPPAQLKRRPPR